jgi:hypothetical protein
VIIYAVVSLLDSEREPGGRFEKRFLSRTHAEHICAQLNRRRTTDHPGYAIEERDTSDPNYDGNVEC